MGGKKMLIVARKDSELSRATAKELGFSTKTEVLRLGYEECGVGKIVALIRAMLRPPIEATRIVIPIKLYELAQKWDDLRFIHTPARLLYELIGKYGEVSWFVFDHEKELLSRLRHNSMYIEERKRCRLVKTANENVEAEQRLSSPNSNEAQQ